VIAGDRCVHGFRFRIKRFMADEGYSWEDASSGSSYSAPRNENLGKWVGVAIVLAVVVHLLMFFGLKRIEIIVGSLGEMLEIETEQVRVSNVEFVETTPEVKDEKVEIPDLTGELLDEIEALTELPQDSEIDIRPDISEPEIDVKLVAPAENGEKFSESLEPLTGLDFEVEMSELGKMDHILQPAAVGQVLVDPGEQISDVYDPDKFNDEMKKGAEGLADKGTLDQFTPLGDMANLSGNALEKTKGMIGSDLLFEYNRSTLRESARNSLLKVALLIDKNPSLNCWIGGHTDLFGGDEFNRELSIRRAEAVKSWLVESMRIDSERLIVIGFGKDEPLVVEGNEDDQAINRRGEIMMRKGEPEVVERSKSFPEQALKEEAKNSVAELVIEDKPVLIKPKGPPIIIEPELVEVLPISPGKAVPVDPEPPKAVPVE